MSRDWKPVVITTKPGEDPVPAAPEGVIDVTEETIGDRQAVADINKFRERIAAENAEAEEKRKQRTPDDEPPRPRAA